MKHKKGLVILLVICAICLIAGVKGIISKASGNNSFSFNFSTSRDFDDDSDEYDEFDDDFYDDDDFDEGSDMFGRIASLKFGKDSSNAIKNIKSPYISVIYINGVISEETKKQKMTVIITESCSMLILQAALSTSLTKHTLRLWITKKRQGMPSMPILALLRQAAATTLRAQQIQFMPTETRLLAQSV